MPLKVYDCVMFSHELDLLKIRLNTLAEVVDETIIVELDKTHSGRKKPYYLDRSGDREVDGLEDFRIHLVQLEVPKHLTGPWQIENAHRRQLQVEVSHFFSSDDIVMISDLDEIPNPEIIRERYLGRYIQNMYYFYLNTKAPYKWSSGTVVIPQWQLMSKDIQAIRMEGHSNTCTLPKIPNGGWHFSSVGTEEDVLRKLTSFAHIEFGTLDARVKIIENRTNLRDIHGTDDLEVVEIDSTYPKYLQDTWKDEWRHLVYE